MVLIAHCLPDLIILPLLSDSAHTAKQVTRDNPPLPAAIPAPHITAYTAALDAAITQRSLTDTAAQRTFSVPNRLDASVLDRIQCGCEYITWAT